MEYHVVKYTGPFGYIKPWTAVRDSETFSQQFLTPSIVEGMEKKLFPELFGTNGLQKVKSHRLSYSGMSAQQEQIQPRGWNRAKIDKQSVLVRKYAILVRIVLVNPVLWLAFESKQDAERAFTQHLCLCRNEDIVYPAQLVSVSEAAFEDGELFPGYELVFEKNEKAFLVGYHRNQDAEPMYGWLKVVGKPVSTFV